MTRHYRLAFFGLSLLTLLGVGRVVTGSFRFVFNDFWFTSGILLVVLLSIVDQPHFSRDASIFGNSVAAMVSLIAVPVLRRDAVWHFFLLWAVWLMLTSYIVMLTRSRPLRVEPAAMQAVSRVNREIGRPETLFSAFFLWGVFKQFTPDSAAYRALLLYWAVFILLNMRSVATALSELIARRAASTDALDGTVVGFSSPRGLVCELVANLPALRQGTRVAIGKPGAELAEATIIDDRVLNGRRFARAAITSSGAEWARFGRSSEADRVRLRILASEPAGRPVAIVGFGSSIGALKFLVHPDTDLVEGEVVAVELPDGRRAYYQIVAAVLREESLDETSALQDVEVTASQLGVWYEDRCRFEPVSWVAPSGGLVMRLPPDEATHAIPEGHLPIGIVPNSSFPVHVSLNDVVTHNTAVIGVTGSGKSYLAFWVIESLTKAGIRVLILDISRQHWIFLQHLDPFAIKTVTSVDEWLQSASMIGIHQYASSTNYPETTAQMVERAFQHLEKSIKLRAGENEPAKLCVVIEEAHSLIPEWNQVAQQGDTGFVNRTARAILQGRKYGMGCMVITQRTANVTKTILNQCNTMLALQSFDQTGLDFMSNYMGTAYANIISTLPSRHAVLVGKASSSIRPILFRISELAEHWKAAASE